MLLDHALGDMEESARQELEGHLGVCRTCALDFGRVLLALGPPHRRHPERVRLSGTGRILGSLSIPLHRVVVAALLLVVATLSAVGGLRLFRPPVFVTSSPAPNRPVAESEARTGLRFEEAGIPGDSTLLASANFITDRSSRGTVALVRISTSRKLDLCGFDEYGGSLWVASRDWPPGEWAATLGPVEGPVAPFAMKSLVTMRSGKRIEETLALILPGARRSALLLVDPATGRRRGTHFHDGVLRPDQAAGVIGMGPLPARDGGSRCLLVCGDHPTEDGPMPCMAVLDSTGRGLQHLLLPILPRNLGIGEALRNGVDEVFIDWGPDGVGLVQAVTSDHVIVRIPWGDGRLDPEHASVEVSDSAKEAYNTRKGDDGAYAAMVEAEGGEKAYAEKLRQAIRVTPATFPPGWEDR